jgi:integrase
MGTVYRQQVTKALPKDAELVDIKGKQGARWKDAKGKTRKALVTAGRDGSVRIVIEARTYTAKFRDGAGIVRTVPTGCRDEQAARSVLADLMRKAERIRSKIITKQEAEVVEHQTVPLADHFADYLSHLEAVGSSKEHRANVKRQLEHIAMVCEFRVLPDLNRQPLENWLNAETKKSHGKKGKGARTRNTYLAAMIAFGNWCMDPSVGRLLSNPFAHMSKANEKADRRRQRRSMTEEELRLLLEVARRRPLLDAMTVRKGDRAGEAYANLRDETKAALDLLGRERAMIYKTLVLTGLRKGELASLTVGQVHLDEPQPFLSLEAGDEKNRQGAEIAMRSDLVDDLRLWLADQLQRLQTDARNRGVPVPIRLPIETSLFNVPDKLSKIFNRDLKAAGIAKTDDRGRTLDVHALRHTFGTLLSKGGVAPRTAQAAMRHGRIDLTMNVYTDPRLLDVGGAMESLPLLSLGIDTGHAEKMKSSMTVSDNTPRAFTPGFTPAPGLKGQSASFPDHSINNEPPNRSADAVGATSTPDNEKHPLALSGSGCRGVDATGFEPVTPSVSSWCSSQLS